jgi:hypothetical protein
MLREFDLDGDATISKDEFVAVLDHKYQQDPVRTAKWVKFLANPTNLGQRRPGVGMTTVLQERLALAKVTPASSHLAQRAQQARMRPEPDRGAAIRQEQQHQGLQVGQPPPPPQPGNQPAAPSGQAPPADAVPPELTVRTLDGRRFTLPVGGGELVGEVKARVAAREGLPPERQQLVFAGRPLVPSSVAAALLPPAHPCLGSRAPLPPLTGPSLHLASRDRNR